MRRPRILAAARLSSCDADRRTSRAPEAGLLPDPARRRVDILGELKRRNIGRVAVLYVLISWLILAPSHAALAAFDVADWSSSLTPFLMVFGFPAVLLLAWSYEITPKGIVRTELVDRRQSLASRTGKVLDLLIVAVVAVSLAYMAVARFWYLA